MKNMAQRWKKITSKTPVRTVMAEKLMRKTTVFYLTCQQNEHFFFFFSSLVANIT